MHWGGHGHWRGHGRMRGALEEGDDQIGRAYDHRVVTRFFEYIYPQSRLFGLSIVTMLVYTVTTVAQPWLIKLAIDSVVSAVGRGDTGNLPWIIGLFLINSIINFVFHYIYLVTLARMGQKVLFMLRIRLFRHLQNLSVNFYDRNEVGRIMSRVQNDVNQLQEFLTMIVVSFADALTLIGIVIALFFLNPLLASITLIVIPILVGVMFVWQKMAWKTFMAVRQAISAVNGNLQENITGVRVIQALNRQQINMDRFELLNREHLVSNLKASRLSSILVPTVEGLTAVAIILVVLVGGRMTMNEEFGVSTIIAFILYIQRFFEPVRALTMQYTGFQRAMTSGVRIFNLLDTAVEVSDSKTATKLPSLSGEIRLENVSFRYSPEIQVIKGIDLHIRPGETVALIGPTGAGKSTLISLIARFYDVTGGRILIDNVDVRDVKRESLSTQMAMVLQEPFLFSGTISENIKYNRSNVSQQAVEEVSKLVGAHEFIVKQPNGYDTIIEERGQNLSLGQRQLLSFARAILANPRILILDEATANVDSYTESIIQQGLREVLRNRTSIVIAHRLSTVRAADLIVVLQDGLIIEQGSHSELMALGGTYAQMYITYFSTEAHD
ncbi:ABC transporter ATP-binding protein [SAR202 cluster bacterium AD-802-E10_MRT_200m]|nr:ABC transporter ATP-binding protein [SAR202 cluster bacterium AD-802-E10_MRT_200m]